MLVIAEKFTFKIPRIAQKVERFYKNIVEESLFGKDPDVTEDVTDPKTSTEAISRLVFVVVNKLNVLKYPHILIVGRRRQRNEICMSLKRSSIIHHVYIGKNVGECALVLTFLALDVPFALDPPRSKSSCEIDIAAFPGVVDEEGTVHFQCKGKKQSFFMLVLWAQIALLSNFANNSNNNNENL